MSSKYTLKLTPQAERDLDSIFDYISYELKNPKAAEDMIDEISDTLLGLEDMPKKHPLTAISHFRTLGIRKVVVKKYIALYLVDEEEKIVTVITVFYGAKDYKNISFDIF